MLAAVPDMRRAREFGDRNLLGDLPDELLYQKRIRLPAGKPVDIKRIALRKGNFSPAIQFITSDGKLSVLPMNSHRNYLIVYNPDAANTLWVNTTVAAAVNACIPIPPHGSWEPWIAPINAIYLVGDIVGQKAILMEGTQA